MTTKLNEADDALADRGFAVTDPGLDAPDGSVVDGYERHGLRWVPLERRPFEAIGVEPSCPCSPYGPYRLREGHSCACWARREE